MAAIVVLGSYNHDLQFFGSRLPAPGETILGTGFRDGPGGKGANQAIAAARLGGDVAFIGSVGADGYGAAGRAVLQSAGVDTQHLATRPDVPTGVAGIFVGAAGENEIVVVAGANAHVNPADVAAAGPAFGGVRIVLAQLEVPVPAILAAFAGGRAAGATCVLNPAPAQALPPGLLQACDVLTPNEAEAAVLLGGNGEAGRHLAEIVPLVIVTRGADGATIHRRDEVGVVVRAPAVDPVDTTGAGDVFTGALCVALAEGRPVEAAVQFAVRAAAVSVTRPGAGLSAPTRTELAGAADWAGPDAGS